MQYSKVTRASNVFGSLIIIARIRIKAIIEQMTTLKMIDISFSMFEIICDNCARMKFVNT